MPRGRRPRADEVELLNELGALHRLLGDLDIFNPIGALEAGDVSAELEALAATAISRPTSA